MKRIAKILVSLTVQAVALGVFADDLREEDLTVSVDRSYGEKRAWFDGRTVIPVSNPEDDLALQGITYSASGWALDASGGSVRTVKITARPGLFVDGVFTVLGDEVQVLAETSGEGRFDWEPTGVTKKIYQLVHTVREGDAVVDAEVLYGFLDFTHSTIRASQEEVELAVLGVDARPVVVVQDDEFPWQPIDASVFGSGIETDAALVPNSETTTAFLFRGCGTLVCEYALNGGTLAVLVDDELHEVLPVTTGWQSLAIPISDYGDHEVSFVYAAAGGGRTAALRDVRIKGSMGMLKDVRLDLRGGVRTAQRKKEVLPFTHSPTNWIGDIQGTSVRVTITKMTGTDPDVRQWVPQNANPVKLYEGPDEGSVQWSPRKGVWKAALDILNGDKSVYREEALFDLRELHGSGLIFMVY